MSHHLFFVFIIIPLASFVRFDGAPCGRKIQSQQTANRGGIEIFGMDVWWQMVEAGEHGGDGTPEEGKKAIYRCKFSRLFGVTWASPPSGKPRQIEFIRNRFMKSFALPTSFDIL